MTTDTHCEQTTLAGRLVHYTLSHWHDVCMMYVATLYIYVSPLFSFSVLTLLVGRQEGHPAFKNVWVLVCWWWWFDCSFAHLI